MAEGDCVLICGDASTYSGRADFIFTHPYASIPVQLRELPAIINLFTPPGQREAREAQAMDWLDSLLAPIGSWGRGGTNTVYVSNLEVRALDLSDLVEVEIEPGRGWFPLDLPARLLDLYADELPAGSVVWDGFCGRGTVGKAALQRGLRYVGIDRDEQRIHIARDYLGLTAAQRGVNP